MRLLRIVHTKIGKDPGDAKDAAGLSAIAKALREGGARVRVWDGADFVLAAVDPETVEVAGQDVMCVIRIENGGDDGSLDS